MPAKVTKVKGGYKVATPNAIHARKTTKAKAESQQRLLNAVEHGWRPTGKKEGKEMKGKMPPKGMPMKDMPASHAHMTPAEHKKAMKAMEKKGKK